MATVPAASGGATGTPEQQWIAGVSRATGIDPRVLAAWQQAEGNPGAYQDNWLNILNSTATTLGVPYRQGAYGVATYGNVQDGIAATVQEMRNVGLGSFQGNPGAQIFKIQTSGWAGSHPPSGYVASEFVNDFGSGALSGNPENPNSGIMGATASLAGGLVNTGLGALTLIPGVNASDIGLPNSQSAQGAAIDAVTPSFTNIFDFITSWRFAEVVGGVLLLLLGLLLLGKQFGLGATPPAAVAKLAPGL